MNFHIQGDGLGPAYVVKQISADPLSFVTFVRSDLGDEPLHRDGRTLVGCMIAVAQHASHLGKTVDRVLASMFGRAS